jgi:hypothetical protein
MSVSLLDVLSCGLAVVVILLVISLNTGTGFTNEEKITVAEITVYGEPYYDSTFDINWNDKVKSCNKESISASLYKIELKEDLDTLNSFFQSNIYAPDFDSTSVLNVTFDESKKMDFLFHPKAKGLVVEHDIDPSGQRIALKAKLTNVSSSRKDYNKERVTNFIDEKVTLRLVYKNGVRVQVINKETNKEEMNFFLKNTK